LKKSVSVLTQELSVPKPPPRCDGHAVDPVGHAPAVHLPLMQTWPAVQTKVAPQPPHASPSVLVSTHSAAPPVAGAHELVPGRHAHVPPAQYIPPPATKHCVPHAPQLFGSSEVSVHAVPPKPVAHVMIVSPVGAVGQLQVLAEHVARSAHAVPHAPQLRGSVAVLVQTPPQVVSPVGHVHTLATHDSPAPHRIPQPPQLRGSVVVSLQMPPHSLSPVGQLHTPETQVPAPQSCPHDPQFLGSLVVSTQSGPQMISPAGQLQTPPVHDPAAGQR
jgi:hypothetical protein